ncbi:hypothetical protein MHYP_G00015840 [Metynnis hypsauchen]
MNFSDIKSDAGINEGVKALKPIAESPVERCCFQRGHFEHTALSHYGQTKHTLLPRRPLQTPTTLAVTLSAISISAGLQTDQSETAPSAGLISRAECGGVESDSAEDGEEKRGVEISAVLTRSSPLPDGGLEGSAKSQTSCSQTGQSNGWRTRPSLNLT